MTEADVQRLLADRKITRVDPDLVTALEEIATARRHIAAAAEIAELDPTLAFTGLYDAMRKAIQAHMRANGYRVSKGTGGHRKTGEYARAALDASTSGRTSTSSTHSASCGTRANTKHSSSKQRMLRRCSNTPRQSSTPWPGCYLASEPRGAVSGRGCGA
jgi:hypothetical protein